jgi:hypothetical protein
MPTSSLTAVWDGTRAYLLREATLLIPVALGTIGLATLILSLATPTQVPGAALQPGPWMYWLIPWYLLLAIGTLALSVLAMMPGLSVREALTRSGGRLAHAVGATLLLGMGALLLLFFVGRAAALTARIAGMGAAQANALGLALALPVLAALAMRFLFLFPALVEPGGVFAALRASWRASGTCWGRLLLLWLGLGLISLLLLAAIEYGLGSLLLIAARMLGDPALGVLLVRVVVALVSSLIQLITISYFARLYVAVSRPSKGI